jgi:hypothetical protein
MGDPMSMAVTGLTIAKGLLDLLKVSSEVGKKYDEVYYKSVISEAYDKVLDLKEILYQKEEEIRTLKAQLALEKIVVFERPYCWTVDGEKKGGPYCPVCWDKNRKLIHLHVVDNGLICKVCETRYLITPDCQTFLEAEDRALSGPAGSGGT